MRRLNYGGEISLCYNPLFLSLYSVNSQDYIQIPVGARPKMISGAWKGVFPQVYGLFRQLLLNKFFGPSRRKGENGKKLRLSQAQVKLEVIVKDEVVVKVRSLDCN